MVLCNQRHKRKGTPCPRPSKRANGMCELHYQHWLASQEIRPWGNHFERKLKAAKSAKNGRETSKRLEKGL